MNKINWSNAPEGATHYSSGLWYMWDGQAAPLLWVTGRKNWFYSKSWDDGRLTPEDMIPRPTKQEWDGGLPRMAIMVNPHEAPLHYGNDHLGKEVEVIEHLPDESCYVVRFDWGLGVLHESMIDFGLYDLKSPTQFLPKVGNVCEYQLKHDELYDEWSKCVIEFVGEQYIVAKCWPDENMSALEQCFAKHEVKFRPLKSQPDSLRKELARVIRESDDMAFSFRPDDIADAVIKFYEERYNLEPKL